MRKMTPLLSNQEMYTTTGLGENQIQLTEKVKEKFELLGLMLLVHPCSGISSSKGKRLVHPIPNTIQKPAAYLDILKQKLKLSVFSGNLTRKKNLEQSVIWN